MVMVVHDIMEMGYQWWMIPTLCVFVVQICLVLYVKWLEKQKRKQEEETKKNIEDDKTGTNICGSSQDDTI